MKHSDFNKGTSPTTGDARPVYTTVTVTQLFELLSRESTLTDASASCGKMWNYQIIARCLPLNKHVTVPDFEKPMLESFPTRGARLP